MLETIDQCDRMLRRIRRHEKMWCGDARKEDQCTRLIGKVQDRRVKLRSKVTEPVGRYSGLTRSELRASGTCETDWF